MKTALTKLSRDTMTPGSSRPSRLESALTRLFTKTPTITECRALGQNFRLITLSGDSLRGVRWEPGQKIQVAVGGWTYRTYTPIEWDSERGQTRLVVFIHGHSPGATWGRTAKEGEPCTLLGPRDSLDVCRLERPGLLFGDETSFGLARSLRFTAGGSNGVHLLFEVNDAREAKAVLGELDIAGAEVIERSPNDSHLGEIEKIAVSRVHTLGVQGVALSGKASSIRALNKRLRSVGGAQQIRTRAYWAPGKVGLD